MDADISPLAFALILVALVLASGYFVAAEFAVLTLRRRRVDQGDHEINGRNGSGRLAAEDAEGIALVGQLGSLVCALLLGYFTVVWASGAFTAVPPPIRAALGLAVVALPYILFGQQLPRLFGANRPGLVDHALVYWPLRITAFLLRPLVTVFTVILNPLSDLLGLSRSAFYAPVHTPEDIRELVRHGHEQGVVEEDEHEMIAGVFEFSETVAREVMTPRIDIVAVPGDIALPELLDVVVEEGHSRIPVYEGSIDNVVGVLLAKDLLPLLSATNGARSEDFALRALMREPYFVPESKPVDDILAEFREHSVHLAIVIDEFGGTFGLLTMEDLLEEIVGEIHDEYDVEEPEFAPTPEGDVLIDGGAAISDVNERFGLEIPEEGFETIGGYIFGVLGRVAEPGDVVEAVGQQVFTVERMDERRVALIRLHGAGAVATGED